MLSVLVELATLAPDSVLMDELPALLLKSLSATMSLAVAIESVWSGCPRDKSLAVLMLLEELELLDCREKELS